MIIQDESRIMFPSSMSQSSCKTCKPAWQAGTPPTVSKSRSIFSACRHRFLFFKSESVWTHVLQNCQWSLDQTFCLQILWLEIFWGASFPYSLSRKAPGYVHWMTMTQIMFIFQEMELDGNLETSPTSSFALLMVLS